MEKQIDEKRQSETSATCVASPPLSDWLKRHGVTGWEHLLEIAESASPPSAADEEDWWREITFDAKDGWKVVIFYDGDTIDYIDSFIGPDGTVIDFWDWPEDHPWRGYLMNWRDVGDLERLKALNA